MSLDCYLKMPGKKRWKSLLVLAVDGSTCALPHSKDIKRFFGVYSINKFGLEHYLGRIVMVYDVLNKFVLFSTFSKMSRGETSLVGRMVRGLSGKTSNKLYVMDRNFDSFSLFKELLALDPNAQLCTRLSIRSNFHKQVMACEKDDCLIKWSPSRGERTTCLQKGLDTEPFTLRVTKVVLSTGEVEILVSTLLETKTYSKADLAELYSLRWGIEEGFKDLKPKMKLEYFGCKKVQGVYQEFYAHIFIMNLVGLQGMIARQQINEKTKRRKYSYTYNWKNGYRFIREKIVDILSQIKRIPHLIDELSERFAKSLIAIKPGRKFNRDMRWNKIKTKKTHYNK